MGFPRIISKNNKIYTKLGEFCLSGDGTHFWIICHTCQEELQTQGQFWKHIQDEHNFLHGMKQEHSRATGNYMDTETAGVTLLPPPLYRKINEEEQRASIEHGGDEDSQQEQQEAKDYTEMRAIDPNAVEIDIKVEPPSIGQPLPPPPPSAQSAAVQSQMEANVASAMYQLPQVPPVSAYATIMHSSAPQALPALSMGGMVAPPPGVANLLSQELPKESNSTTASASSAVSSDDGERWYICDYETCGLKFKYQSRLELHRSVHSKERRFACELCGASFKQSCNLSTHRKKKHFLKGSKGIMQQPPQQRF